MNQSPEVHVESVRAALIVVSFQGVKDYCLLDLGMPLKPLADKCVGVVTKGNACPDPDDSRPQPTAQSIQRNIIAVCLQCPRKEMYRKLVHQV